MMELRDAEVQYNTDFSNGGFAGRTAKTAVPVNGLLEHLPALAAAERYSLTNMGHDVKAVSLALEFIIPGEGSVRIEYTEKI